MTLLYNPMAVKSINFKAEYVEKTKNKYTYTVPVLFGIELLYSAVTSPGLSRLKIYFLL